MNLQQTVLTKLDQYIHNFPSELSPDNIFLSSPYKNIIVFSHLRWEFVKQRPQHILERLAKKSRILFIEEPIPYDENTKGTAYVINPHKNISVLQPRISLERMNEELKPVVLRFIEKYNFENPLLWFYSASFSDLVATIPHSAVVYDCMDELSAFKGASPQLQLQEKYLLKQTDVVFTGGKSLYESKKKLHNNVYCFPSSVDKEHFDKSLLKTTQVPKDIASIKSPIVGFYGVIDERINLQLLAETADSCPDISFVMIGPVVKIAPAELPKRNNIFYLGQKKYSELPEYLKGFDIAFMPFALNESTQFISPTKTLEFMAAHKPIISTPIYDVVRDYSHVVSIVTSAQDIKTAIQTYLAETAKQRSVRINAEKKICKRTSWDNTVASMQRLIRESVEQKLALSSVINTIRNFAFPVMRTSTS